MAGRFTTLQDLKNHLHGGNHLTTPQHVSEAIETIADALLALQGGVVAAHDDIDDLEGRLNAAKIP